MLVAFTIALATLILTTTIIYSVRAIYVELTILIATVEWVGRKQLGEYEPPEYEPLQGL